jgi:hypothetical protein
MGIGFRNSRREQNFKAGGVGFSRESEDQTKNSFTNRQIVNTLPFSAFFTKNENGNKIDPVTSFTPIALLLPHPQILLRLRTRSSDRASYISRPDPKFFYY